MVKNGHFYTGTLTGDDAGGLWHLVPRGLVAGVYILLCASAEQGCLKESKKEKKEKEGRKNQIKKR